MGLTDAQRVILEADVLEGAIYGSGGSATLPHSGIAVDSDTYYYGSDNGDYVLSNEPTEAELQVRGNAVFEDGVVRFKCPVIFEGGIQGLELPCCDYCGSRLLDEDRKCVYCGGPR